MTSNSLTLKTYPQLRKQVEVTLLLGQRKIESAKVETYWKTGKIIQQHIINHKDDAEYGSQVVIKLAKDLEISETLLYRCLKFVQKYPHLQKVAGAPLFSWTHYCSLITIADDKQRISLEKTAGRNAWSSEELASRIKAVRPSAEILRPSAEISTAEKKPLIPLRGQLYTYKLTTRKTLGGEENDSGLLVDLGFGIFRDVEPRQATNFSENDIVESKPKEDAYKFYSGKRTIKDLFTYQARVERVIDGDTLKVRLDLGFDIWNRQVLRLRGIDCPEMDTGQGQAAKSFVQSYLKDSEWIIVRSSRSDKYDRYLADVFIPQNEPAALKAGRPNPATLKAGRPETDIYLNNLLLEKGHARRMAE
jgi:endonuclease YncB( thermonuclease family)